MNSIVSFLHGHQMIREIKSLLCLLVQCNISFKHRRSTLEIFTQGEMQYARRLQHLWHAMRNTSPLDSAALHTSLLNLALNYSSWQLLSPDVVYFHQDYSSLFIIFFQQSQVGVICSLCVLFICLFALFKTGALQPCHDRDKNNNEDTDVLLWVRSAKTDWGPQLVLAKSLECLRLNIQTYCSLLAVYMDKQRNTHASQ